jgi:hypothetical protein
MAVGLAYRPRIGGARLRHALACRRWSVGADDGCEGCRDRLTCGVTALRRSVTGRVDSTPEQEDVLVSIVVRFSPVNLTADKYDDALRRHGDAGIELPPDGMQLHVCFGEDGDLRVSEIWDSREQLQAYGERLMPLLAEAGIELSGEPEIFEAHNIITR